MYYKLLQTMFILKHYFTKVTNNKYSHKALYIQALCKVLLENNFLRCFFIPGTQNVPK